ncbi:hypothetical protein [Pseudorhodoferax sp. Leaf274]|nr:hypothetical protein [Pseudorhodoferax sp. Leaf274]
MAELLQFLFALAVLFLPLACAWLIVRRGARHGARRHRRPMR